MIDRWDSAPVSDTPTGFHWGSAEVLRVTDDTRRGSVVIAIRAYSPRSHRMSAEVEVVVSRAGRMRVLRMNAQMGAETVRTP